MNTTQKIAWFVEMEDLWPDLITRADPSYG